ncbi:MAG: PAS domain S-box protein [Rhodoferax sp.]|jgi:PAS domain S-box-containing protein|nr:PAS domain S-box protein [Rhodoferax sp.]MBP9060447.1 PAS domain S-box protein [Rhodoferax sp.]MBP9684272.1 PAS domain S-box protein [Rhodoferax sp.]
MIQTDFDELEKENHLLREELKLAHAAAKVTSTQVVQQFEKTERVLRNFQDINAEHQAVLDAVSQLSLIATDLQGTITLFNQGAMNLLGFSTKDVLHKKNILSIYPGAELKAVGAELSGASHIAIDGIQVFDQLVRRKLLQARKWHYQCKNGDLLPVSVSITGFQNASGERIGYLHSAMDITQHNKLERALLDAKEIAEAANQGLTSLLDNSGQGFMSFGPDMVIDAQYSLACETMMGRSPAGCNAADLFFHDDADKADLLCSIIASVLTESDPCIRESMLSLLPVEIRRDNLVLKAEYKTLENGKFMVILTDITEERRMAAMLGRERRRLELIVMAVSDSRNFFETIEAFREFLANGLPRMLGGTHAPQLLVKELYREIHTYKGLLSQFSFPSAPKALHEIETQLSHLLSLGDALTTRQLAQLISVSSLQAPFNADLTILSDALGEDFLSHGDSIFLSDAQARQLEKLAVRLLRGETVDTSAAEISNLLHEIGTLRKVSLRDVLLGFDGLVKQAAKRMEKEVAPIEVSGGADVWIDPNDYRPFLHSLVHVFRNAVAHGLETPEARWEAEKDEIGKISCTVSMVGNAIHLCIADDGGGINLKALRQRAVAAGIYAAGEVEHVPDDAIAQLIFMDNISTQQEVSDLAGRGIGLAAVLSETKNRGGEVVVKTVPGQGTQFLFALPQQREVSNKEV